MLDSKFKIMTISILLIVSGAAISAEDNRYVTDELEITLHRNMSLSSEIVAQLKSGTPVKVLQTKRDEGYVKVSTQDNKVGWMLESYLISMPAARQQLAALRIKYDELKENFDTQVKERTAKLSTELSQVKNTAKRPLELQQENQKLKKIIEDERAQVATIKQENHEFKSIYKDRQWFITGAITAIGSLVLGLILTKVPWRRRKSWGEL